MDKIKILFLAANPRETGQRTRGFGVLHGARTATSPLRLDVEIREITAKIRASEHRDAFELIQKWAVRSDDLLQALLEHKPHIVHFCGHGNSGAQIILEDEHGHPHPVNKEALVNLFQTLKDNIRVVVLNACWTGLQAKEIVQTVDYAIGMNKPIGDPAAIIFAAWFYHAIGSGRTILEAYSLAKVALQLHRVPEDETPEIFVGDSADTSQRFHAPNPQLLNDGANVSQIPIRGYFGVETDRSVISGPSAVRTMDKVKILFLAANRGGTGQGIRELGFSDAAPAGTDALHLDGEIREITARIRASEYRDSFELIPKWAVRPDDLLQALLEHKPHMVHFSGHGSSGAETILQDANGRPQPLNLAALVRLFQTLKDNIRVVVLNACCTREEVEGLAKTIDFAVGMNQPIGDERAIVFAASFYETIGFGRTINEAFNLAKVALLLNGVSEDNTPEMFVRAGADASERFFTLSSQLLDDGAIASQIPIRGSPKELADRAKSTKDLVDLSWFIGNVATEWRYSKDQAESAYSQYRLSYEGRNAHVKILGKSAPVELAKIYTEVRIVAPEALRGYRSLEELHDSFLKGGRALAGYDLDRHTPRSGLDVANDTKNQFLSLLGAPGAGKSTFLRFIGLMALRSERQSAASQQPSESAQSCYQFNLLPIMLELRLLRSASADLATLIDEEMQAAGFPPQFGRAALLAGCLLVLLDGLDEVRADKLDDTIQAIRTLTDRYPMCRYIISCRTAFYRDFFPRFTDALLTDFTDDQIQNFIQNWFHSGPATGDKLWDSLRKPEHQATCELARTPLLATFLCLVYDDRQKLPTNRAELYGDALRILLERWAASKRILPEPVFPGLTTKGELLMLEGIAGPAYERNQYFFTAKELAAAVEAFLQSDSNRLDDIDGRKVVEEIERKQGLFVQRAHDKYSFSHLTLQEYLAACHYHKVGRSQEVVKKTLTEDRWRDIHLLLAGLQEPDADAFLLALTVETIERVSSGPLNGLLSWSDEIVRVGLSPNAAAAGRALMLALALTRALARNRESALDRARDFDREGGSGRVRHLALAITHALDLVSDCGLDRDLALARDRALERDSALARNLALARDLAVARDLALNLAHTIDRELVVVGDRELVRARELVREVILDLDRDLVLARDRTPDRDLASIHDLACNLDVARNLDLGSIIMRHGIIDAERNLSAVLAWNDIERSLNTEQAPAAGLLREFHDAIHLPPTAQELSARDVQQCIAYLKATRRIVECREAAERVTQPGWDRVCERLFAPLELNDIPPRLEPQSRAPMGSRPATLLNELPPNLSTDPQPTMLLAEPPPNLSTGSPAAARLNRARPTFLPGSRAASLLNTFIRIFRRK